MFYFLIINLKSMLVSMFIINFLMVNMPVKYIPDTFTILFSLHVRDVQTPVYFLQEVVQVHSVNLF
jgi:hypothetical protein